MTAGGVHASFPVDHASRVGEARRHAAELAREAGLQEVDAGRLALVVTELGTNLQRHAAHGRLLLAARAAHAEVEVIAMDQGPGIANVPKSMGDGYSTGGTPGTGLGAVRRLADDFELHTSVPQGTVIVARVRAERRARTADTGGFQGAAIAIAAPGEQVCGDGWAIWVGEGAATLVLADGLGHGPDAAAASQEAIATLRANAALPPGRLLEEMHARLRTTRGAAVSIYRAEAAGDYVRWVGAGHVLARLVSGVSDRALVGQHGTVGLQMRTPQEVSTPWPPHALLVAHTDGIESRWQGALVASVLGRDPALAAALLLRDHCRGRDDATVVVVGRSS
jgi:anti-sigma regulatory factor (Ser/Thr protein kinase)